MRVSELKPGQVFSFTNSHNQWFVTSVKATYIVVYLIKNNTITFNQRVLSQNNLTKNIDLQ